MGKVDTAAVILEFAFEETSSEVLEKKMELPPMVLDEHLRMLKSKGLIGVSKVNRNVKITKRGTQFLELYKSIHEKYLTVPA